jgi:foldase protein PrsA
MLNSVKDAAMDETTFWATTIDGKMPLDICKENALESAREFNIQMLKVKEKGIKLTAEDKVKVQSYIDNLVSSSYNWTQKQEYVKTNIGVSYNEYKRIVTDYYLISLMEEQVKSGIEVSEEEILAYYEENRDTLDKVTINRLTIAFKDYMTEEQLSAADSVPTTEQKEKAREDAVKYLTELQGGGDFTEIVKEYMGEDYTEETQIEYSFTSGDTTIAEGIRTWAFSSETVDFNMIETDSGFEIVQWLSRTAYEDAKDNAKNSILTEKYNKLLEEWKASPDYDVKLKQGVYDKIV